MWHLMNRPIENEDEKIDLLERMIRFQSDLGVSGMKWMKTFNNLLIELPTLWFIVNEPLKEEYSTFWEYKYGNWPHGSGNTKAHNKLGMAYAWWALHEVSSLDEIVLQDSPDIRGRMNIPEGIHESPMMVEVRGDIGTCTPVAMLNGLKILSFHDVWISVLDWHTQVFIQFGYSPVQYQQIKFSRKLWNNDDYESNVKKVFYCEDCREWSVTEESRNNLVKWFRSL